MADLKRDHDAASDEGGNGGEDVATEEVQLNDTVAEEKHDVGPDLKNRDPDRINAHVEVRFEDIFAESDEEIHSFQTVWCMTYKVFSLTKTWCYRVTSLILGLPLAVIWGLFFACLAFCNNWCYMPCFKCCKIELHSWKMAWTACIEACIVPCCQSFGYIFSKIRVNLDKDGGLPK